jgi:hypothetical protein
VKPPRPLNDEEIATLNKLANEYVTYSDPTPNSPQPLCDKAISAIKEVIDKKEKGQLLTREDLHKLEMGLFEIKPIIQLRAGAWALRERFEDLAGDKLYNAYIAGHPPDAKTAPEEDLRADLEHLLGMVHELEDLIPAREHTRRSLTASVTGILAAAFAFALWTLYSSTHVDEKVVGNDMSPTLAIALCIAAGTVGGFASMQLRLQKLSASDTSFTEAQKGCVGVIMSPVRGAVFAMLLYALFVGGFLEGVLFPKFMGHAGGAPGSLPYELHSFHIMNPQTMADFAKLIVWSFIAGFAERLVPDALERLAAKTGDTQRQKTARNKSSSK